MSLKLPCYLTLIAAVAATAFSQGPPGGGRPGARPPSLAGMPASGAMLLSLPEVREELVLTKSQRSSVEKLVAGIEGKLQKEMGTMNPAELFNLSEAERQKKMNAARKRGDKIMQQADASLHKILSADQSQRLKELRLQFEGGTALLREDVAQQLDLTSDQLSQLKQIETKSQPQFGGNMGKPNGPPDFAQIEQTRKQAQAEMLAVLNDQQKTLWDSLIGKPFTFSRPEFGPGQRPRFGGAKP